MKKKDGRTSFSEEKEAKRLLLVGVSAPKVATPRAQSIKSFLVLFFKKEHSS
jgi:hypothetical protein